MVNRLTQTTAVRPNSYDWDLYQVELQNKGPADSRVEIFELVDVRCKNQKGRCKQTGAAAGHETGQCEV